MNSLEAITLKAFLTALIRLDDSLPVEVQKSLNEAAEKFPANVSQLHVLAKSYSPLNQEYMEARLALEDDSERLQFTVPEADDLAQISDEQIINFAVLVLKSNDSVNFAKTKAQESNALGKLLLGLVHQTSFMVKNSYMSREDIPEEERWLWQNPRAWASLERGLRQAQAGKGRYLGSFAQYAGLEIDD